LTFVGGASAESSATNFGEIAARWWNGVESGTIGKRRGAGDPYSETTLRGYGRDLHGVLIPEFGGRLAEEVTELEWQCWIDGLRDAGLSRSRIANLLAVASAIYGWAARPTRKLVRATRSGSSNCRRGTRSRAPGSPPSSRPKSCSPALAPTTRCPTRSPSTQDCEGRAAR